MDFKLLLIVIFILKSYINANPIETVPTKQTDINPHIIGGDQAPEGYAPYMAAILIGYDITLVACGGSLVLPNLILTAAHCIDVYQVPGGLMRSFHAVVGSNNFKVGGTAVEFAGYHIHPEWDSIIMKNDIGFLSLRTELQRSQKVELVALNFDWVGAHEPSFVTGWGLINIRPAITPFNLQILEVNTVTPQTCVDVIREVSWWPQAPTVDPALEICSLNSVSRSGLCNGDSGSPLMSRKSGSQIGIASWAIFPCASGVPDMHTRLSAHKDYIHSIMEKYQH